MTRFVLFIFLGLNFGMVQGQLDSADLLDYPVYRMEESCFGNYPRLIVEDTVNRIEIFYKVYTVDRNDQCVPGEYEVFKTQYNMPRDAPWHMWSVINCETGAASHGYTIPPGCGIYVRPDSTNMMNFKAGLTGLPDSVCVGGDLECALQFYATENDTVRVDTVLVKCNLELQVSGYALWECNYFYELKHGEELGRYSYDELAGVCIGNPQLLKFKGNWKYGDKHGKWFYYAPTGEILRREKYRRGKLVKSE